MASIPAPNRLIRLALVGAGRWGRIIIRTLAAMDGARLVAVASANPGTMALVPADCRIFTQWREMLATDGDVDGVIIATPPASHAEIAEAAMARGLAVLIEKPLTLDLAQARHLGELPATAPVMVGHVHLCAPAWRELKRRAAGLGPIRRITATAGNHGPYRSDVGVLWDWGAHDVAMALDLLGGAGPDRVAARRLACTPVAGGMAERIALSLGFGAVEADVTLATDMDKTRRFQVECQDGTLVYDDLAPHKLTLDGAPVAIASDPPLAVELRDFIQAVRDGSPDRTGLDLGIRVVESLARAEKTLA